MPDPSSSRWRHLLTLRLRLRPPARQLLAVRTFNSDLPIVGREGRAGGVTSTDDDVPQDDEDDPCVAHLPDACTGPTRLTRRARACPPAQ